MDKRYVLWLTLLLFSVVPFALVNGYSIEYESAYTYAYSKGITTAQSINSANMDGQLTRIAMAKMISNYAINILELTPDTSKNCYFSDVSMSLDYQYDNGVTKACQLGLMGVGISQFYPNGKVTRAEFGTVLSRALNARNTTELNRLNNATPYYYEHLKYLKREGIMNNISNPSSFEHRGNVMLMMLRSDRSLSYDNLKITGLLGNKYSEGVALFLDTVFKVANLDKEEKTVLKTLFSKNKSEFEVVNLIPENFKFSESEISDGIDPYYEYNGKRYISPDDTIYRYKDWFIRIYKDYYGYGTDCISLYNEKLNVIASYDLFDGYSYHNIYISHIILDQLVEDRFYMVHDLGPYGIIDYNGSFIYADSWSQEHGKFQGIPETLNVFGEEYTLENFGSSYYGSFFGTKTELENKINNHIKENLSMGPYYMVRFSNYPTLLFTYGYDINDLSFRLPSAVFRSNPGWKTDNNGNIIDINQTRQLTCYFGIQGTDVKCKDKPTFQISELESVLIDYNYGNYDDDRGYYGIIPLNSAAMPFYKVKQSKIPGYYYFYAADGKYLGHYGFDMGKPVVYVYDAEKRENVLNVELVKGGEFKHIEPQFTTGTSWNFTSDEYSNIIIDGEVYPYMYYTSTAPGYLLNKYGWTVLGEDIEYFLNAKFDTIGLNEKEKNDFMEYWLPYFNKDSKYFISFKFNEELDPYAKLSFKYEPDNVNRVFMEAIELGKDSEITFSRENDTDNDDKYLRKFKRGGFEALEWGAYFKSL